MENRTAFLDLNGTLVSPVLVTTPREYRVIEDAPQAVAALSAWGFRCPVVTVQSRIGRGLFSEAEFRRWFTDFAHHMRRAGAYLEGPYVCPHRFAEPCRCKKPQPFLYQRAADELGLTLRGAFVIGDSAADIEAAHQFGGIGCLVRPRGSDSALPPADHVAASLTEIVDWIIAQVAA